MANYQMPRGTQDLLPADSMKWIKLEALLRQFTYVYNYQEIRTPIFEHTEVFKRGNDSSDMVNKEMYTFTDNGGRSLTLRPEGTAGVARSFVENKMFGYADMPVKMYYMGPQFRYERPQKGRLRIFHQFGVEVIGAKTPYLDVEVIALGYSIITALGLKKCKVLLNTLGDDESRNAYRQALKEHFKDGIQNMCTDCQRRYEQNPLRILDCKVDADSALMKTAPKMRDYLNESSKEYFTKVCEGLKALGIPFEIEDRLVRGLDYYTHTVFELISESEEMGSQSTVLAGGRYDGMVEYFGGPSVSGIGWAMGMERLLIALESEGIDLNEEEQLDAYILCLSEKVSVQALQITTQLRSAGYRCDTDYLNRSFKAQFKTVERKHAKMAIIVGEKDIENGTVTIKNIADQTNTTVALDDIVDAMDRIFMDEEEHEHAHECSCGNEHCTCHQEEE